MSNIIRETYTHEKFGTLRVIFEDGNFYYCGKDVCNIFGISEKYFLGKYCKHIRKEVHETPGGFQVLNFIGADDIMNLYEHSKVKFAEEFVLSLDELEEKFEREIYGDNYDEDWYIVDDDNDDEDDDSEDDEDGLDEEDCDYEDTHNPDFIKLIEDKSVASETEEKLKEIIDKSGLGNCFSVIDALSSLYDLLMEYVPETVLTGGPIILDIDLDVKE